MFALRRGLSCLGDPGNRDRLRRCNAAAMREIAARLLNLKGRSARSTTDWPKEEVAKLIEAWRAVGGGNT
jgi:hypothetical protein